MWAPCAALARPLATSYSQVGFISKITTTLYHTPYTKIYLTYRQAPRPPHQPAAHQLPVARLESAPTEMVQLSVLCRHSRSVHRPPGKPNHTEVLVGIARTNHRFYTPQQINGRVPRTISRCCEFCADAKFRWAGDPGQSELAARRSPSS